MPTTEIGIIVVLSLLVFFIVAVALLIVLWFKSSYRKKDLKIKELQKEIEQYKSNRNK